MRRLCRALGAVLLAAALCLTAYNLWDAQRAADAAAEIASKIAMTEQPDPVAPGEMPTVTIDGVPYIGVLEIPSLSLSLPVAASWDYEKLKNSPCRYAGSYLTGDLVIAAHNYAKHFSPIKWVEPGAEVVFRSVDGQVLRYTITNRETLQPVQIEDMITPDGWDLTLFTCNTGGQTRCAVRCVRA